MKTLLVITLIVALAGCAPAVPGWQVMQAAKACESRGGVGRLVTVFGAEFICADGFLVSTARPK